MARKGRKRKLDSGDIAVIDWEKKHIMSDELLDEMKTMWEIPQIYHFLHLTKEALNIGSLSMYEMERMLLMPRASKQLAQIMTCLLSSPMLKTKLRRIPPMPYEYWTNILMHKIKNWFKIYHNKHEDTVKVLETIGVEPAFWRVFPDVGLIEGKDFEELTFRQRVWILKTVCDAMMHARKTVQEEMAKQFTEEPSETLLGIDRHGARYIYFPEIMENDVRIYKHCLDNKILSTVKPPKIKVESKSEVKTNAKKVGILKSSRSRRRKCRWRNGSLPPRIRKRVKRQAEISNCAYNAETVTESLASEDTNLSTTSICSNNNHSDLGSERSKRSRSSSKNSDESVISNQTKTSHAKSSGYDTNTSNDTKSNDEMPFRKQFQDITKSSDVSLTDLKMPNAVLENLPTVTPITEEDDMKNIKITKSATNNVEKIDEKLNDAAQKCSSTDADACGTNNNDHQSNFSVLLESKTTDMSSAVDKTSHDRMSKSEPEMSDVTTSFKEGPDTTAVQTDELSNSSKTDDEKLNDIKSIDGSALDVPKNNTNVTSPVIHEKSMNNEVDVVSDEIDIQNILTVSKSDDQKLIETKFKDSRPNDSNTIHNATPDDLIDIVSNKRSDTVEEAEEEEGEEEEHEGEEEDMKEKKKSRAQIDDSTKENVDRKFVTRSAVKLRNNNKSYVTPVERKLNNRPRRNVRSTYQRLYLYEDVKSECESEEEPTLSELRDRLLKENKEDPVRDSQCDIPVWEKYNLRKPKKIKKEETDAQKVEDFHEMLGDLGVSSFQLVADSIEALREEVLADILSNSLEGVEDASVQRDSRPQCEIKLIKQIRSLLATLELRESALTDATKKARAKLHKEWTNFKDGVVEDQDWSSEGSLGLGSNWWVIGSQGYHPLPPTSDATISPLSHSTLPSPGNHNQPQFPDDPKREHTEHDELQEDNAKQQRLQGAGGNQGEIQEDTAGEQEEQSRNQETNGRNKEGGNESEEETNLSSKRVLRTRGVSSYMEQDFTSDDETEEDELERWPDVEAKYVPTCTSPNTPATPGPSTSGQAETWESEDSDQDWLLPCARKRKNRRPAARNLKSLQQKLQNMNNEVVDPNASLTKESLVVKPTDHTVNRTKFNQSNQKNTSSNLANSKANEKTVSDVSHSQAVPSNPICKIESIHSEIDIKEEVPMPNNDQSQNVNNYNVNVQPAGYVVVKTDQGPMTNYYLMPQTTSVPNIMQQSTIIPNVVPTVQPGYYVQAGQNYIMQAPQQANFLATQTLQSNPQPLIVPQARPQLFQHAVAHNYMQMPGYVVHSPPVHQATPRSFIVNQNMQPNFIPTQNIRMPNQVNVQSRSSLVRNGTTIPHGAVIRSNAPPRMNVGRSNQKARSKNLAPRAIAPQLASPQVVQNNTKVSKGQNTSKRATKSTSLIVLSDSDDEIEMIITEKATAMKVATTANVPSLESVTIQPIQKPVVTSHVTVSPGSNILPPQIMQRMSQGGISITPVKTSQSQVFQNPNTQLVVVVNETGSHYALSLPNGSKLILTPDQVAQIRASNNGKLML